MASLQMLTAQSVPSTFQVLQLQQNGASSPSQCRGPSRSASQGPAQRVQHSQAGRVLRLTPVCFLACGLRRRLRLARTRCRHRQPVTRLQGKSSNDEDWVINVPTIEEMEKVVDGVKYVMIRNGTMRKWVREDQVGNYRLTDLGYLGRGEDGKWSHLASMPKDLSHLTDEQLERYKKEVRGELRVPVTPEEGDEDWKPMAKVPPLDMWPYYEAAVANDGKSSEAELEGFKHLDMTSSPGQAGVLASRWKAQTEERRHLGYSPTDSLEDVTNINSACNALKCLTTELQRLASFKNRRQDDVLPHDHRRLDATIVTTFLGTQAGSAMALWTWNKAQGRINIDLLVGDNITRQGLVAEENLLKWLFKKAGSLGAKKVWCRSKRSESGRVITPTYFTKFGFKRVSDELQQRDDDAEEFVAIPSVSGYKVKRQESVKGLRLWLAARELEAHLEAVNSWCVEMGAADVAEVAENREDLAESLGEQLTEEERERLLSI